MTARIYITDDGDEEVFVSVGEEVIAIISHEAYGWDGMLKAISLVEVLADSYGIPVTNVQGIV